MDSSRVNALIASAYNVYGPRSGEAMTPAKAAKLSRRGRRKPGDSNESHPPRSAVVSIRIDFENSGYFVTAWAGKEVLVRRPCKDTDMTEVESLENFIDRHGGPDETVNYLQNIYKGAPA